MLRHNEFLILRALDENGTLPVSTLAEQTGLSPQTVENTYQALLNQGFTKADGRLTDAGRAALEPYRVKGAIILAAGASSRFAPLSFERPKALFKVHGEVLIERLVRQLREAGIDDIVLVVGAMKEQFFYLEERLGVTLIDNPSFSERNNHASLWTARDYARNAYICSSDQFYAQNLFHSYEYRSFCSIICCPLSQGENPVVIDDEGRIIAAMPESTGAVSPNENAWCLLGPAYLSARDADMYFTYLEGIYNHPSTAGKLWETILLDCLDDIKVGSLKLEDGTVSEFDYLEDLCAFDTAFLENADSAILDNICRVLNCARADISDVRPLMEGLTNLSVFFRCKNEPFVYRHPGVGTDELINRQAEAHALNIAAELGLDTSFVFEDVESGWKISRFIPRCTPFDYQNECHVKEALSALRTLHTSGASSPWTFNFYEEAKRLTELLKKDRALFPEDFGAMAQMAEALEPFMRAGAGKAVLCHNDFYGPNILVNDEGICLIDWEYAAMGDYGCDLGNFVAQGSGYGIDEALGILPWYFGRPATAEEERHFIICIAMVGWYWYVWALYKEAQGSSVGEWLRTWYDAAKLFGEYALKLCPALNPEDSKLTEDEFNALVSLEERGATNGASDELLEELSQRGLIAEGALTAAGVCALEPYRARRAIFFAAGFGSRMLPITVNTPKPLVRVHGMRIIDRLLDAVTNVGIEEIYIVRGYLKEEFDQLLARYPQIHFIDNPLFDSTNNISSAILAKDFFQNAYAFESDLLLENPELITKYQYRSNYLAFPVDETPDWCFEADDGGRITSIAKGADHPCWQMVGASYWSSEDGARLSHDLEEVFESGEAFRQIFWDDVALAHRSEHYNVFVRPCAPDDITEIDTFAELQAIDEAYRI